VANVPKLLHFGGVFFLPENLALSTIFKYQIADLWEILHFFLKNSSTNIWNMDFVYSLHQ